MDKGMYKVTASEERNEKAAEYETKSMLYMMNYYEKSDMIHWFVIDFFNDVTGVNKLQDACYDIQSKGVKNIAPMEMGRYLVTLFKNFVSPFNFEDFVLFIDSVSVTISKILKDKSVFTTQDLSEEIIDSIKTGLKDEAEKKTYIENKSFITDETINDFLKRVTFVIDTRKKEDYIKDAVELSNSVIVDDKDLRKIFKEIRDKQSSKKNNGAEGELLSSIGCFQKYDKHIRKDDIQDLIINRICFKTALRDDDKIPKSFIKISSSINEDIMDDEIENCQDDIFRLMSDKNNKKAFWDLFSESVRIIKSNPCFDINQIYDNIDKSKVNAVRWLDALSCKYFLSLIKDALK